MINKYSSRDKVLKAVKDVGLNLEYASEELKADKKIVMAAVKQDGRSLEYASKELRADKKIVMAAVNQSPWAFEFASEKLQRNKDVYFLYLEGFREGPKISGWLVFIGIIIFIIIYILALYSANI
jgi:CxxC motif-containing protein